MLNHARNIQFDSNGCRDSQGHPVLKFSKEMSRRIEAQKEKSYLPKTAKVRFIVYWQKEDTDTEIRTELYFEKV